jgi:DNA-binding NtrC family response regulator
LDTQDGQVSSRDASQLPVVLIVEDEILIRMSVAQDFRNQGFTVLEAHTGEEAKTLLDARPDIDVVFTDLVMPGTCSGLELAQHVKTVRPDVPVLLGTAHVIMINPTIAGTCCAGVIHKPYNMQRVVEHVKWLAESPPLAH